MTFNPPESGQPGRRPFSTGRKRPKALIPTLVILVLLVIGFGIFTSFVTDLLWFKSVGFEALIKTQPEAAADFRNDVETWGKMARSVGVSTD